MQKALRASVRPGRRSEFQDLVAEAHGGDKKRLIAKLIDLTRTLCVRKCGPTDVASCGHARSIICKGRVGYGLGLYVFSYDQRIPNSQWDEHTVLCRALTVMIPLPENLRDAEEGPTLDLIHLEDAVRPESKVPLEVAECMPKFWEADTLLSDLQKVFGTDPNIVGVAAAVEKVDGSLGTLYPARDPQTLDLLPDALPFLSSKSVGWSPSVAKNRAMLQEQHPHFRLPKGASCAVVEVVTAESQVCVPYQYEGFRLLAMMQNGRWLTEGELDEMGASLGMPRPKCYPLEKFRRAVKGGGGYPDHSSSSSVSVADVMAAAESYVMSPEAGELQEGWVVVLQNGLRLKVHTEAWNIIHGWWSNRISPVSVAPLLYDPRIKHVPFEVIHNCLCGPLAEPGRLRSAEQLREMLEVMRPCYAEQMASARESLKETAATSLRQLKDHPLKKMFQSIRGKQRWVESIPEEVDVDAIELPFEAIRDDFIKRVETQLRTLSREKDVESVKAVETKLLRAIVLCLEPLPASSPLSALEAELGRKIPEELLPMIAHKNVIGADAAARLSAVLAQRESSQLDGET